MDQCPDAKIIAWPSSGCAAVPDLFDFSRTLVGDDYRVFCMMINRLNLNLFPKLERSRRASGIDTLIFDS